jgi:hypothetical protein
MDGLLIITKIRCGFQFFWEREHAVQVVSIRQPARLRRGDGHPLSVVGEDELLALRRLAKGDAAAAGAYLEWTVECCAQILWKTCSPFSP